MRPSTATSPSQKKEFYRDLSRLLRSVRSTNIVAIASDFSAQLGYLTETKEHIGGRLSVPADRIDNSDRLFQVCSNHRLFLAHTNFCHEKRHRLTWCRSSHSQRGLTLITLLSVTGGKDQSTIVDHCDQHIYGLGSYFVPSSPLFGPSLWSHQQEDYLGCTTVCRRQPRTFNPTEKFLYNYRRRETHRILANTDGNSNKSCTRLQVLGRTFCHVQLKKGGYPLPQFLCWMLADSTPPRIQHTKRCLSP